MPNWRRQKASDHKAADLPKGSSKQPLKLSELEGINLTAAEAFLAMGKYVTDFSTRVRPERALVTLLSGIEIEWDEMSGDPAALSDWVSAVEAALSEHKSESLDPRVASFRKLMKEKDSFRPGDRALLRRVVHARDTRLIPLLAKVGNQRLTVQEREALRGVLADELTAVGLDEDDEPTDYGRELDELIGRLMYF